MFRARLPGLIISSCGCQTEATTATIHCQVLPQPMTYSDAAAAVAAERLTALAQSSKAIENARQVPQDRRTSLAGLACRPRDESGGSGGGGAPASALKKRFPSSGSLAAAGGSTAAADGSNDSGGSGSAGGGSDGAGGDPSAADTPFTEADLPNLKVCTRPNGARVVLGGGGGGSAGEVRQIQGLVYSTLVSPTIFAGREDTAPAGRALCCASPLACLMKGTATVCYC